MGLITVNDPAVPYIGIDTDADNYIDKVPVALYGPNGEPLLVKTPTGETRRVIGAAIYGDDGTAPRPVKVDSSGRLEAVLSGSNASFKEITVTTTPLEGNQTQQYDLGDMGNVDVNGHKGAQSIQLIATADKPTTIKILYRDSAYGGSGRSQDFYIHPGDGIPLQMPWQPVAGQKLTIEATNLSPTAQTVWRLVVRCSSLPLLDDLYSQLLPLDSGSITLAAGATYTSPLFIVPRVKRLSVAVSVPTSATEHLVYISWRRSGSGTEVARDVATRNPAPAGATMDFYVLDVPTRTPWAVVSIKNNGASQVTFDGLAVGWP